MRAYILACLIVSALSPAGAQSQSASPLDVTNSGTDSGAVTDAEPETPILDDESFEAALPDLEPETDLVTDDGLDTTPSPVDALLPPTDETTAELTDLELPEAPPLSDPALEAALPPLETYDLTAAPDAEVVANNDSDTPPPVRYDTRFEGFHATHIDRAFKDLSVLRDGKGTAGNLSQLRARLQEDEILALRLLKSHGYYDAVVRSRIDLPSADNPESRATAVISVVPGEIYTLSSIAIEADPTEPPTLIRDALPLNPGDAIDADLIKSAEANVTLTLPQQGYPFAQLGLRDVVIDPQTRKGDYTLPVTTGPRSRFNGIRLEGDPVFKADHIRTLSRFESGDLYDVRMVDDLREAMTATGLFASVGVEPELSGETAEDGTAYVTLKVTQNAGKPRTLAGDIGFSTGQGLRTEVRWTHRNRFPPEGAVIFSAVVGTQEQGLGASFRRSNAKRRDRTVQAGLSFANQTYDSYEAMTLSLSGSVSRVSTPLWQKKWTWSYGAEILATQEKAFDLNTTQNLRDNYFYASLPTKIGYDVTNDLLNPSRGFRAGVQATPFVSLSGGGGNFFVNVGDISYYREVSPQLVLATRARLGSIYGADLTAIAPSRRLYAGGGGSVRGFGYQELGPRDINNDPTGGRSAVELAFEVRYRFKDFLGGNLGIVPFVDAGQVYHAEFPEFSDIRFGVGIGARYYTNFGPLRVDIATPISRRDGESPVSLYVGIGQAF
ncbi:autotransporter assembly complex protein TamA [Asticcacaulis tiandongensis]|uniref:autotransporter assembly complex protein TamA n=1 Tax=Asticcacaulis tiandongensis TaxID=2565365 RepID=UPI001C63D46B|nr:BamA/TamA family outer membrane protein [Asticcacaulis tiandongensis]